MSVRGLLERAVGAVERWQLVDAPRYQIELAISLTFLLAGCHARRLQDVLHGV